jgi:ribA/ribD-fused uncharacterized protein
MSSFKGSLVGKNLVKEKAMSIAEFQGEYRFLSNFWLVNVIYDHQMYSSVEHAYQAAKTLDDTQRRMIQWAEKPGDAKRMGQIITLREDWEQVKLLVMKNLVWQKFQYPNLKQKLLATGDQSLIEGNRWHDNYWGVCLCGVCQNTKHIIGHNYLGRVLMDVRDKLAAK